MYLLGFGVLQAQNKKPPAQQAAKKPAVATPMPDTIKIPKFSTRFGPYNGKLIALADDLKKLLGTELIVTDERGQKWNIVAWRFIWNRKEINDDWKTGKRKTIFIPQVMEFDNISKLPEVWQKEMKEFILADEELFFERIIVEHPVSKRKMLAPGLNIKIK